MKSRVLTPRLLVLAAATLLAVRAAADFDPWPRVIVQGTVTNTIYQPQLDSWDGFFMKARAVVTLQSAGDSESVYGVIEVTAHTVVDKTQRTVQLYGLQITGARFPSAPDNEPEYLDELRRLIPAGPTTISLDRLEANLAILQQSQKARSVPVENTPPRIIFSDRPALLLRIDGLPVWSPVEGPRLQRVLNTRVLLLRTLLPASLGRLPAGDLAQRALERGAESHGRPAQSGGPGGGFGPG